MPSRKAEEMVRYIASKLKGRREALSASLSALSLTSDLDRAALKRAESGERISSPRFWIDWADSLGTSLEGVIAEARQQVGKQAGEPPERRRII